MAKWILLALACFVGCSEEGRLVEQYDDHLGYGSVRVIMLDDSSSVFVGHWESRQRTRGSSVNPPMWDCRREFASADSARKFVAEIRGAYELALEQSRQPKSASPDSGAARYGLGPALRADRSR